MRVTVAGLLGFFTVACSDGQAAENSGEAVSPRASAVSGKVDSILPSGEVLRRFLAAVPRTEKLAGGAGTPDELVRRLMAALERKDTAGIAALVVSRAEYGWLYYPTSVYASQPYELSPDLAWMLASQNSAKGARRLLQRLGGRKLELTGLRCDREHKEGQNRFREQCRVSFRDADRTEEARQLFHAIIERDGQAKFLSYAGDF